MFRSACLRLGRVMVLLVAVCATGCHLGERREPPPLAAPQSGVSFSQYAGTPLSGELTSSIDEAVAKQAWGVSIRAVAVKKLPEAGFEAIGPHATLVLSDRGSSMMNPSTRLVYSTAFQSLDPAADLDPLLGDAKSCVELSKSDGAVAPGTTFALEITQPAAVANRVKRKRICVEVVRPIGVDGYQLVITSDDRVTRPALAAPANPDPNVPAPKPLPAVTEDVRETIVVPQPKGADKSRVVLTLPMDFAMSGATGVVIDVTIDIKPAGADALATKLKADVDASSARAAAKLKQAPASADDLLMTAMLDSLAGSGDAPRASLVYAAQQSGAMLTENVSLVADDKVLALITKGIREKIPKLVARDRATVAWMLDRTTIQTLASIKDDETIRTLSAVQGALVAYAGEAGRQLDLLQSLANESTSSEDLDHRLIAEHLNYLEDNSPAARVRAFDWLQARGFAPPDYDPLAPTKQRRDALEKFHDVATTKP